MEIGSLGITKSGSCPIGEDGRTIRAGVRFLHSVTPAAAATSSMTPVSSICFQCVLMRRDSLNMSPSPKRSDAATAGYQANPQPLPHDSVSMHDAARRLLRTADAPSIAAVQVPRATVRAAASVSTDIAYGLAETTGIATVWK